MHKGREEDASTGLHRTPRGHYDPGLLDYGHEQQHRNIVRLSEEDPSHGDRLPHFCHPHCGLDRNGRLRLHHRHVHVICPNLLLAAVPIDPSAVEAAAVVSDPGEYMDVGVPCWRKWKVHCRMKVRHVSVVGFCRPSSPAVEKKTLTRCDLVLR